MYHASIVALTQLLQNFQFAASLADAALKSFVILGAAGCVCLFWRRSAAATRHWVWFLSVSGLLILPGLSGLVPGWQRPLWTVGTSKDSANEITLTLALAPDLKTDFMLRQSPLSSPATPAPASAGQRDAASQRFATHFRPGWAVSALAAWLSVMVIMLFSIWMGRLRLRSIQRTAQPPSNSDWLPLLHLLRRELDLGRQVTLLQSAEDVMPVTWGWWRPVILLPAQADQWSPERRRIVLLHELAHIKRWDCLTQTIARLACAVYWFNPLVWIAARRMRVERERACDDLVLSAGCKASDYAGHLLEIARTFRRVPRVAAIAMARSSQLEGRIAAIVDPSRARRGPRSFIIGVCVFITLAFIAAVAAQKPPANSPGPSASSAAWYNSRLQAFFVAKEAQARQLAAQTNQPVAAEVWRYFDAGIKGDWQTATNLWQSMRRRAHQYEGTTADASLDRVWGPILETDLAWQEFANWSEKYVLAYGNDIIKSIPSGSIYLGGTDPGRGVITAMSESHAEAKPFFTITQNALADGTYLEYLRSMYGSKIYTPSGEDSQTSFAEYLADAQRRLAEKKLKPGEDVQVKEGRIQVSGQVAVMAINALLVKTIFDRNPEREFYIEESFPLDWMYPHLVPNGLIMKINRQALPSLSDQVIQQDHEYWSRYLKPIIGDWLDADTSIAKVVAFVEKVYLKHDLRGFQGDAGFVADTFAQKGFSKLRASIGGVYQWRLSEAKSPEEKKRMTKAADLAFRQAYVLCPTSPEALFRYVNLLATANRQDDARLLAETSLKLDPENASVKGLLENLKQLKAK
jgi:beta-lactamase regulating signal transducer with metallopeptidase domain